MTIGGIRDYFIKIKTVSLSSQKMPGISMPGGSLPGLKHLC